MSGTHAAEASKHPTSTASAAFHFVGWHSNANFIEYSHHSAELVAELLPKWYFCHMSSGEEEPDIYEQMRRDVAEVRPEWGSLDPHEPSQQFFLLFAAVALTGRMYAIEATNDDGETELIKVESLGSSGNDRYALALSSDKEGSELPNRYADIADKIFRHFDAIAD